jgi:hypothetical protein
MKRATRRLAKAARMEGEIDMGSSRGWKMAESELRRADRGGISAKDRMAATGIQYCNSNGEKEFVFCLCLASTYGIPCGRKRQLYRSKADLSRDLKGVSCENCWAKNSKHI